MPRTPSLYQTVRVWAYLSEANAAQLHLMTYVPGTGRNRFGEQSRIINEALELYFRNLKEQNHVLP